MTIEWAGPNQGKFRKVLLEFYPDHGKLRRFVRDNFTYQLTSIGGDNAEDWAEQLLEETVAGGWIDELFTTFCSLHWGDPRVLQLRQTLNDPALDVPIGESSSASGIVSREGMQKDTHYEDPCSVHLVVAVFWEKPSEQKIRVSPKLCYRDVSSKIQEKSLVKEGCALLLKQFPAFLERLIDFVIPEISRLFPDPVNPWKLRIELFVPVDLLAQPLSTWCGSPGSSSRMHSVVIGCSDRFDPDRLGDALNLHNQLKRGWQRFQSAAPDHEVSPLSNLTWLDSDRASQESFERYSGFQCYGGWLKPDPKRLDNWKELVRSGIPLALWFCEGSPPRADTKATFEQLIRHTRFEFLEQIPIIRDELNRNCDHCFGVFFEDPNYVPDIPLPKEEQFFSWPGS